MIKYRYRVTRSFYSQGGRYVGHKRAKDIAAEQRRYKRKHPEYEVPTREIVRSHAGDYVDYSGDGVRQAEATITALGNGSLELISRQDQSVDGSSGA